jgi:hypothetical protein
MPKRIGNGPGHGGPAKGPGYGGPAKGEGNHNPTKIREGVPTPVVEDNHDRAEQEYRLNQKWWKRDVRQRMAQVLIVNAENAGNPGMVQITAANMMWDRLDGKPVSNVNLKANVRRSVSDMTEEELLALAGDDITPEDSSRESEGGTFEAE